MTSNYETGRRVAANRIKLEMTAAAADSEFRTPASVAEWFRGYAEGISGSVPSGTGWV